jgi:xanthine/uracil permease
MRLASWLFLGSGVILCLATFAGWVGLNLFACGLASGGCSLSRFRFRWEDTEALMVFVPPFVLGSVLTATGMALQIVHRQRQP